MHKIKSKLLKYFNFTSISIYNFSVLIILKTDPKYNFQINKIESFL